MSNIAIPWKNIDPNLHNPVRNTKSEYLKFLNTVVFSEEARHFLRNGYYTNAPYGSKDYNDYWDEQEKRCLEGYSVGGVRITGRHYYYLNFTLMKARPIDPNTGIEHIEGKKELTFPRFLDHQYYLFNEIEECMAEGPHIGKDRYGLVILKSRRKGLTYCISNGLYGYNFTFIPASTNILGAYEKQHYKVTLDGIHFGLNHINKHTDWAKRRQKLNKRDHFRASFMYKDSNGVEIEDGYMSEVMALSFKDNEFKSVGDCFKPNQMILNSLGESVRIDSIKVGDYVMGIDGSPRKILNVHSGTDLMTTYEQNNGVSFTVNTTHKHYGKLSSGSSFFTISSKDFLNRGASFRNDFKIFKSTGKEIVPDSGTTIYPVNNYYGEYVGIEVDGDHLFLLDDFTIVHNSASLFGIEEAGKFNNLLTTYPISIEPLVRDGDVTTGFPIIYGSAGDMEGGSIGLAEMFYNPKAYGLKSYENIYDENATGDCGYFIDDLWYLPGKYKKPVSINGKKVEKSFDMVDKEGNSIRDVALESLTEKRVLRKKGNKDAYLKFLSQQPLNPREALLRTQGNMFDAVRAQFRLSQIETNPAIYIDSIYRCNLTVVPDTGEIKMEINNNIQPVYEFPIKDNKNKPGIIEIYELPVKNSEGKVPYGLYIFGCLLPGEKVLTNNGLKNVEDVSFEDKLINKDGEEVDIKRLINYDVINEDIYEVKVSNSYRTTKFTKEHPILYSKPNRSINYKLINERDLRVGERYYDFNFSFNKVESLSVGDWIKVPNIYLNKDNSILDTLWKENNDDYRIDRLIDNPLKNKDFWWFIGYWLGDGWCDNNGYSVEVVVNKEEPFYLEKLKSIIENLFNRKCTISDKGNSVYNLEFSLQQLNKFIGKHFGKYSYGKKIPEWVKKVDNELLKYLVLGYLSSDGCIGYNYIKNALLDFVSVNLELLESIQDILFSMGIRSSIELLRNESIHHFKKQNGDIIKSNTRKTYQMRVGSYDTINFRNMFDYSMDPKLSKIKDFKIVRKKPEMGCFLSKDLKYIYFKVKDIKKSKYTGIVYNFECETNTFMCRSITTHNCDSFDDDASTTDSVGSMLVFNRLTQRIVAHYKGRPMANQFYENCRRLAKFYNARGIYERRNKGIYGYFLNTGSLHLLAEEPEILREKGISKANTLGNNSLGIAPSTSVNAYGRELALKWMSSLAYNEEADSEITNLDKIRSIPLLKEIIAWNSDGNFDDISALGLLMIYAEDRSVIKVDPDRKIEVKSTNNFWDKLNTNKYNKKDYSFTYN